MQSDLGRRAGPTVVRGQTAEIDAGLRSYMLRVYNYMTTGLLLTGLVAFVVSQNAALVSTVKSGFLGLVVALAPLGLVFFMAFRARKMSFAGLQLTFWAFSAAMGLSLSYIFVTYTGTSIARVFFITAGTFAAMSLWGYTTRRDLTGLGHFLIMGLIGVLLAIVVNIFMQSAMLQFIISVVGVLVFTGLTAYDTQKIKEMYHDLDASDVAGKKAIMGALTLYLDFINIFLMLLHLFGNRE